MIYRAPPTVGRFLGSDARNRLIVGPYGSGKSSGCCVETRRRAKETPPGKDGIRRSRWAVVRNTYPELRDTTIKTFLEWVPEGYFGRYWESDRTFEFRFETEDGCRVQGEVMFRALDKPDDVKKLLSLELTGAYLNEAKEIPKPVFDTLQARVGRYPRRADVTTPDNPEGAFWHGIWMDTNPPDVDHYLYKLFVEREGIEPGEEVDFALFKQPGGRSPLAENLENLPGGRAYYDRLVPGKDLDWVLVNIDGEFGFVRDGKPVYPEFVDSVHVPSAPIPLLSSAKKLIIGNDYGLTPAAVWVQQDPSDGQYQVIREFVSEHLGAVRFGEEQRRICRTEFKTISEFEGWGDPAGMAQAQTDERTPIDIINAAGVPMNPTHTNDFTVRREAVAGLLTRLTHKGRPALIVSPACKTLRKGMAGGYTFRRLKVAGDARFEDKPLKNHFSHVCEALQYACVGAGEDLGPLQGSQAQTIIRVNRASGESSVFRRGDGPVRRPHVKRALE